MRLGEADGIGRFAVEHAHLGMRQIVQLARGILPGRLVVGIVNCLCDHVLAVSYPAIITSNGEDSANLPGAAAEKRRSQAKQRPACWTWPQGCGCTMSGAGAPRSADIRPPT